MKHGKKRKTKIAPKTKVVKDEIRLLSASGSGYVKDPDYALGAHSKHTTPSEVLTHEGENELEPEPEGVDKDTQKHITDEARARYDILHAEDQRRTAMRARLDQIRRLAKQHIDKGKDPIPYLDEALDELKRAA